MLIFTQKKLNPLPRVLRVYVKGCHSICTACQEQLQRFYPSLLRGYNKLPETAAVAGDGKDESVHDYRYHNTARNIIHKFYKKCTVVRVVQAINKLVPRLQHGDNHYLMPTSTFVARIVEIDLLIA